SWKCEVGSAKLEVRSWKCEVGSAKLEVRKKACRRSGGEEAGGEEAGNGAARWATSRTFLTSACSLLPSRGLAVDGGDLAGFEEVLEAADVLLDHPAEEGVEPLRHGGAHGAARRLVRDADADLGSATGRVGEADVAGVDHVGAE